MELDSDEARVAAAEPWLGPFRFEVGFDGFRQLFHAENDRYMRKLGFWGTLFFSVGGICSIFILADPRKNGAGDGRVHVTDIVASIVFLSFWIFFIVCLVRPPFGFSFRLDEVARFFVAHGGGFAGKDVDPRGVAVSVSTSLCSLGGEEVTADGTVVRTPFMLMRGRPVWTRDFLFLGVRDRGRDSVLWNVAAEGGGLFRRAWDGDGVALPRACVPDWRAVSREVRARVREASGRYRRAVRLARRAGRDEAKRKEALALVAPELAWLGEADRLNAQNMRLREEGGAPPVAQRLVPVPGPGRTGRALRAVWRWMRAAAKRLRVLAVRYNKPLSELAGGHRGRDTARLRTDGRERSGLRDQRADEDVRSEHSLLTTSKGRESGERNSHGSEQEMAELENGKSQIRTGGLR
ncbi:hypothetical protein [Bifidobacterium sp. ESL0704]|uniref:hypothetical protein n=1 Tax=Bifidobacterium sp. ESL0704 TaxID=2983219 RepID=UPI0023F96244|nr:hypothetical protein [Bifidobacterium sp. ESL0704]WEV53404.1 hypothetical protein OZX64_02690 [Bifidobacterium sp. ESL0704]